MENIGRGKIKMSIKNPTPVGWFRRTIRINFYLNL